MRARSILSKTTCLSCRRPSTTLQIQTGSCGSLGGSVCSFPSRTKASWAANAAVDVIVDAIARRKPPQAGGINDPTIDVGDPRVIGGEDDLALDLARRPRPDKMAAWVRSAGEADPFKLVANDMRCLSEGIKSLLGSDHPVLEACAKYLFELDGGKKIRPTMVLLVSKAAAHLHDHHEGGQQQQQQQQQKTKINGSIEVRGVLDSQKRLAEITEMIHTASLFHDDVIDEAETRRGMPSINKLYGNKMAVLAGDFLLARASISLARLRDVEVVELLSTVIEHLVKGEVMQSRPQALGDGGDSALEYYLYKNYYKTGSLMANSCRAAVMLGGHGEAIQDQAFAYGRHVGLAFQLVDDVLDFEQSSETLGKPALNDLKQGIATAPVLFAAEDYPEMIELIRRKFRASGDIEKAVDLVERSGGLRRAKDLALVQAEQAMEAALGMVASPARDGLIKLAALVVQRTS